MTDLLGVMTAWEPPTTTVQPDVGPAVVIDLADVVSGKPVPPRASPRHRVSSRSAESHALVLWPTVENAVLGDWVLRSETRPVGRLLKRANSCLALGDPGQPPAAAAAQVREFYDARGRDALVQVEADGEVDGWFAAAGWSEIPAGASTFLLAGVGRALRTSRRHGSAGRTIDLIEDGPRALVELPIEGKVVASGRGGYDGDWVGLHSLVVEPGHRRRGLGTALMAELLDWAAGRGATTAWLHVQTANEAALGLYEGLGFTPHHHLRYRGAPPREPPPPPQAQS